MTRFAQPEYLFLLLIVPFFIWWHLRKRKIRSATLKYSNVGLFKGTHVPKSNKIRQWLFYLRMAAIALTIVAFSRPQSGQTGEEITTEGIDIMLAVDVSSSMLAEDFKPQNRIEAAKSVAADFIQGRNNDRIGMVVFAGKSFTQCPLTLDYGILLNFMKDIKTGIIEDGTAIGLAIANATNRLRNSEAKSKVVILLTDGRNNKGEIDPITAAKVANAVNVKVYTVGVGTRGKAPYPVDDPFFGKRYVMREADLDEDVLKDVSKTTGGQYFRATDRSSLEKIFENIDKLEKTKIEVKQYTRYSELFPVYLWAAFLLLLVETILTNTRFRKIP